MELELEPGLETETEESTSAAADSASIEEFRGLLAVPGKLAEAVAPDSPRRFQLGVTEYFVPWLLGHVQSEFCPQFIPGDVSTEQLVWGRANRGPTGPGPIGWCVAEQCSEDKCSFVSWCASKGYTHDDAGHALFAPVTTFVSHAWKCGFLGLVDALEQHAVHAVNAAFFVDIFMINQHVPPWSETPQLLPDEVLKPPIDFCRFTLLVLSPFDAPVPLSRSWCIFEILTTNLLGAELDIRIPSVEKDRFSAALASGEFDFNTWVRKIDIEKAEAFSEKDRMMILNLVRAKRGVASLNAVVIQMLCGWLEQQGRAILAAIPADQQSASSILMESLAKMLWGQGKTAEAYPLFREMVAMRRRALGAEDAVTLAGIYHLAKFLRAQGDIDGANDHFIEAAAGRTKVLGATHSDTLDSMREQAVMCRIRGKNQEAEAQLRTVIQGRCQLCLAREQKMQSVQQLIHQGQVDELSQQQLDVLVHQRDGEGNGIIQQKLNYFEDAMALAQVLMLLGKDQESAKLILEVKVGRTEILGADHRRTTEADMLAAELGLVNKRIDDAALANVRDVLARLQRTLGSGIREGIKGKGEHYKALQCMKTLALMLDARGEFKEAREIAEKLVQVHMQQFGDESSETYLAKKIQSTILLHAETAGASEGRLRKVGGGPGKLVWTGSNVWKASAPSRTEDSGVMGVVLGHEDGYAGMNENPTDDRAKVSWEFTTCQTLVIWSNAGVWTDLKDLVDKNGCPCVGKAPPSPIGEGDGKYWNCADQRWTEAPRPTKGMFWDPLCCAWKSATTCFNGEAMVLLADGRTKMASEVTIGDKLAVGSPKTCHHAYGQHATVIARLVQAQGMRKMVKIGGLLISPMHRIVFDGQWVEPILYPGARIVAEETILYNFFVGDRSPIVVEGITASTIGTHCEGSHDFQWPTHAVWGSAAIVDIFKHHPDWPNIQLGAHDTFLNAVKDPGFASEYLAKTPRGPEGVHCLLSKHGWIS
jgi:tetratricopeptide (TPR) repeat protein